MKIITEKNEIANTLMSNDRALKFELHLYGNSFSSDSLHYEFKATSEKIDERCELNKIYTSDDRNFEVYLPSSYLMNVDAQRNIIGKMVQLFSKHYDYLYLDDERGKDIIFRICVCCISDSRYEVSKITKIRLKKTTPSIKLIERHGIVDCYYRNSKRPNDFDEEWQEDFDNFAKNNLPKEIRENAKVMDWMYFAFKCGITHYDREIED